MSLGPSVYGTYASTFAHVDDIRTVTSMQPSFTTTDPYGAKLCHRECSGTESSQE